PLHDHVHGGDTVVARLPSLGPGDDLLGRSVVRRGIDAHAGDAAAAAGREREWRPREGLRAGPDLDRGRFVTNLLHQNAPSRRRTATTVLARISRSKRKEGFSM